MSKLYIGNLPTDVNEGSLRQLFQDHGITCTTVLVKRGGYAFVDCPDQPASDRAIDKLNGYSFMGKSIVVEPSVASGRDNSSNSRVHVSNIPLHVSLEDLEQLFGSVGRVQTCEKQQGRDPNFQSVQITYETGELAQQAVSQLNGYEYDDSSLRVDMANDRRGRSRGRPGMPFSGMPGSQRQADFPLRILVLGEMVGAIIGRQGSTIRQITQQTRARVDVHRKDNVGSLEKAITIYGAPENCTNACKKILEVMQQEANNTNKGEVPLKVLAHNSLIGRIIGKQGTTIKKIMQDTDTRINVSSINDISSINQERIITVKGTIESISQAESMISTKLRQCYENDIQAMAPQSMMFPGVHPMAMMSTLGMYQRPSGYGQGMYGSGPGSAPGAGGGGGGSYSPLYPPPAPTQPSAAQLGTVEESVYLYIPNMSVGAIIGTKGSHIRHIIRFASASIKIAPLAPDQNPAQDQNLDRKVTIVGTAEAQWKAQFMIFEKMREEGHAISPSGDVSLTTEIMVPSSQVGRIIGKGGQNVRELQRMTGCIIKLPEQGSQTGDETPVHMTGTFYETQSAQRRVRAMINQAIGMMGRGRGVRPPQQ